MLWSVTIFLFGDFVAQSEFTGILKHEDIETCVCVCVWFVCVCRLCVRARACVSENVSAETNAVDSKLIQHLIEAAVQINEYWPGCMLRYRPGGVTALKHTAVLSSIYLPCMCQPDFTADISTAQ